MSGVRRWLGALFFATVTVWAGAAESALRTARDVHRLTSEAAAQRRPVVIEAVVTHFNRTLGDGFFVQDESDGVYVSLAGLEPSVSVGDRVRVHGVTTPGAYAPVVELRRLESLGAGELPAAARVSVAELASGRFDSRRVELRAIVRSARVARGERGAHLALELRVDGHDLIAGVNRFTPGSLALPDAEIVVRGVAAGVFSRQRQLLAPVLAVESDSDIDVIDPPRVPEALPLRKASELFHHSPDGFTERRVRLRGQLLGRQPGHWLAVRDETSGLLVATDFAGELVSGDQVELVGFPAVREQTPWLIDATVRRLGPGPRPEPRSGSVAEAMGRPYELRRLAGRLEAAPRPGAGAWVLALREAGGREFEALVPTPGAAHPAEWREGAMLAVTGVTEPFFEPARRVDLHPFPRNLRLRARGAEDVTVERAAPWRTSPEFARVMTLGLAGALVLLGSVSAIALLLARKNAALREARRSLRAAQEELARRFSARTGEWQEELAARHAAEADYALLTAERTRLARELHDGLEQTIASAALQLDAASAFHEERPEEARRLLHAVTGQLRESQAEIRRSVWNLRAVKLEDATLPDALQQLGRALRDAHGPDVRVTIDGSPALLPSGTASHLFRIAQEGLTNALKHSRARVVTVKLEFEPAGVTLEITDDGLGFDPVQPAPEGHYGLRGLRERASALRTELALESAPGAGTRIRVRVPSRGISS